LDSSPKRRSFEFENDENALRYANIFTVFFLFFKYGQHIINGSARYSNSLFRNVINRERRLVKSGVPVLRHNLLGLRQ
jgi:hypothetical protein